MYRKSLSPLTSACPDPHHCIKPHLLLYIFPQIVQKPLLVRLGLSPKHMTMSLCIFDHIICKVCQIKSPNYPIGFMDALKQTDNCSTDLKVRVFVD